MSAHHDTPISHYEHGVAYGATGREITQVALSTLDDRVEMFMHASENEVRLIGVVVQGARMGVIEHDGEHTTLVVHSNGHRIEIILEMPICELDASLTAALYEGAGG